MSIIPVSCHFQHPWYIMMKEDSGWCEKVFQYTFVLLCKEWFYLDNWALSCSWWSYYTFQSINLSIHQFSPNKKNPGAIIVGYLPSIFDYGRISTAHFRLWKDIYRPFSTYHFSWAFSSNMSALSFKMTLSQMPQ